MGAIDLVVQIEAPPSVASGLQRIGRAGHTIGAASRGIIVPKFRGDLVACAAVTRAMHEARIESSRYPRNPLDVLAQQIVAMVAMDDWDVDALFAAVRRAAPFAELSRGIFEGVLDMLSGRYPSDEFADLRPRLTWDRLEDTADGARGRETRRGDQRRHDSGPRAVRRVPDRRTRARRARRRARRRDGVREPRRRDVPARRVDVAHRGDHARSRARVARARRAGQDAVLEGGRRRAGRSSSDGTSARWCERCGTCRRRAPSSGSCRTTISIQQAAENLLRYLADQAAAAGVVPGRPHDPDRALPRRARRLAHLRAHAVRRPHPRALGDGGRRTRARRDRRSTSRRCGPTTGSWCGFRRPTSRRTRG